MMTGELGKGGRVGELRAGIITLLATRKRHLFATMDIAECMFPNMMLSTQDKEYRRVLRALNMLQIEGVLKSYHDSQRAPRLWWLASRVVLLDGQTIEGIVSSANQAYSACPLDQTEKQLVLAGSWS